MSDTELKQIASLINGMQRDDPRLYRILSVVVDNLDSLIAGQNEIRDELDSPGVHVTAPTDLSYELKYRSIGLSWTPVAGAFEYEIREGTVWETAELITRIINVNAELPPRETGTYNFLVKTINSVGVYSTEAASVSVVVPPIPLLALTVQVIDNNVLLSWDEPDHPFEIIHYHITKDGNEIGFVNSTFFTIFESLSGTYTYGVQAHDVGGSHNTLATIQATVNQPPDYVLEDLITSTFTGTKTNCIKDGNNLVAIVDTSKDWANHFSSQSWNTIQDQINAGFPIYIQPGLTTGSYEEVFDFGAIFSNIIASVSFSKTTIAGAVTVVTKIAVSDDNITYTSFSTGLTYFASSARYVKVKLEFSSANTAGIIELSDLKVSITVKREMDGGIQSVLAADTGGTVTSFNKAFKDVESITVTPLATAEQHAIVYFVDAPNPTDFKILLYNAAGSRIDGDVYWKARGIL